MADIRGDLLALGAEQFSYRATAVEVDVSDEASVNRLFRKIEKEHGKLDILVNNAALMLDVEKPFKPFWEIDVTEWDRVMAINTRGVFLCCRGALSLMMAANSGKIVNVTSDAIWHGYAGQLAYFASKGAVAVMTRCLARELGQFGINVNSVAPGLTSSEAVNRSCYLQEIKADIIADRALRRDQVPADVVRSVLFLCSDDSSAITGQSLVVNCGGIMV